MALKSHLPVTRINTIMKSSSDVEIVSKESSLVMAKAAELFIKQLAKKGFAKSKGKLLDYQHVAEIVQNEDKYEFLQEMMPKKITVLEYKKMQAKINNGTNNSSSSEDESGSEDSSEISESS